MALLISDIPDGADMSYIIDSTKRITSNEVSIVQLPDIDES